jgi:hypothetical protein
MLDTAKDEAQQRVNAVEEELAQAHEAERSRLLEQIGNLQHTHGLLQGDVSRFERHLEARRTDVKSALDELNAVLDDPELLRAREALEPAEIGVVDTTDYPPIAVEVMALHDLEEEANTAIESTTRPSEVIDADELDLAPTDDDGDAPSSNDGGDDYDEADVDVNGDGFETTDYEDGDAEPATVGAEVAANGDGQAVADGSAPPPPTGDPFLDELRRATNEEPSAGDPITDFLEEDNPNRGGGWFGRRK